MPIAQNKEKVKDNYLSNLKFTVSKTGLKMLCHVSLICTIYCITDIICTAACWKIEVMRFLGSSTFVSFSIMSTRPKKAVYQKIIIKFGVRDFQNKNKFLTTAVIIFFINNKTRCTYFNPFMPGGSKRSNIFKQTYVQKLLFILSMYELLLLSGMRMELSKKKAFVNF